MNPFTPYLMWIKLGALGLVIAFVFGAGCHVQKGRDAAKVQKLNTTIDGLQASLRGSAKALRQVNEEAKRRIAEAEKAAVAGLSAGLASEAERKRQEKASADAAAGFERALLIAQRRTACKAWLDTDVSEVCGL